MSRRDSILTCTGAHIALAHTVLGSCAFIVALGFCLLLHYRRVVKNHVAGYPEEWWPSVSATIGDWYPERNVFQLICATASGFRFLMVALCATIPYMRGRVVSALSLLLVGLLRTIACGGWIFITSSDDAFVHDVTMGTYLALTPLWMALCLGCLVPASGTQAAKAHVKGQRLRAASAVLFYGCTPFMVYYYLRHRRDRIPGMYTRYSFFEWGLVLFDILFDSASAFDLKQFAVHIDLRHHEKHVDESVERSAPSRPSRPLPGALETWLHTGARVYLAFTAWSTLFVLAPIIFYFSVANMSAQGVELLVLAPVLGLLLTACTPLKRLFVPRTTAAMHFSSSAHAAVLWVLSLAAVVSYAAPSYVRLAATAFSCAVLAVLVAVDWSQAWETNQLVECMAGTSSYASCSRSMAYWFPCYGSRALRKPCVRIDPA